MPYADHLLTLEHEKQLWDTKELDMDTSKGLLHAVMFYLIKCFAVWQGKELRQLQTSHVSFGESKYGKFVALDLQSSHFKRKRLVKRYDDPANPRSVYKIIKKYQSRIVNEGPFLLRPISSIKDFICYSPLPLGIKVIKTFISTLMEEAGIGRCFVNYSLNLQCLETLVRFGTGSHCLSSWLMKNNLKSHPKSIECSSSNCEDLNPEISIMVSRLLDTPYPSDAVAIIQKMEQEEQEQSKMKDPVVSQTFESWMTNLMEDDSGTQKEHEQNHTVKVLQNVKSKEIEKETTSHETSGNSNILFSSSNKKLKVLPKEDKAVGKDLSNSKKSGGHSGLKIMTVSTISADAFSIQVDDGDCIGNKTVLDTDIEDCLPSNNINHENDSIEKRNTSKYLCAKKRKIAVSDLERMSEDIKLKEAKLDDISDKSSIPEDTKMKENDYSRENDKLEMNKIIDCEADKDASIVSGVDVRKVDSVYKIFRNTEAPSVDEDVLSQLQNSLDQKVTKNHKGPQSLKPHQFALKQDTVSQQFNFPSPNSSQDSITILRKLLQQQSNSDIKSNDDKICQSEKTGADKCKEDHFINSYEKKASPDISIIKEDKVNSYSEGENSFIMVGKVKKHEGLVMDLSPSTLSPHPSLSVPEIRDEVTSNRNFVSPLCKPTSSLNPTSGKQCGPNLVSSNIVQFLDKAHQQIKNILDATADKSSKDIRNTTCDGSAKTVSPIEPERHMPSKHSRKAKRPVKVTNVLDSDEESPLKDKFGDHACGFISPKSPRLQEQLPSQFPLLRLFLENPIEHTEIVMASQSTLTPPPETNHVKNTSQLSQSPLCLNAQSEIREPPKLTFMGNPQNNQEICSIGTGNRSPHNGGTKIRNNSKTQAENHVDLSALSDESNECPQPASSFQLPPSKPLSPVPPTVVCDTKRSNIAVYHMEKDSVNNVVYQTLHVNSEKEDKRTFTFADIPYVRDQASNSKKYQGSKQTSEINLGDYFPPGTVIPAKDIHLITKQGPDGCDIVMKFHFRPKT